MSKSKKKEFKVIINQDYCKGCGYCAQVCEVNVFEVVDFFNAKGYKPMGCKSSSLCIGCLKCYFACPDFAIDIVEEIATLKLGV